MCFCTINSLIRYMIAIKIYLFQIPLLHLINGKYLLSVINNFIKMHDCSDNSVYVILFEYLEVKHIQFMLKFIEVTFEDKWLFMIEVQGLTRVTNFIFRVIVNFKIYDFIFIRFILYLILL